MSQSLILTSNEHTGAWDAKNLAWYFKEKLHLNVDDDCFGELNKAPNPDGVTGLSDKQVPPAETTTASTTKVDAKVVESAH